jgi:hypothetical protein
MYAGYKLTEVEFQRQVQWPIQETDPSEPWDFLRVEGLMRGGSSPGPMRPGDFERQLGIGKQRAFKLFRWRRVLAWLLGVIAFSLMAALAWLGMRYAPLAAALSALGGLAAGLLLLFPLGLLLCQFQGAPGRFGEALTRIGPGLFMGIFGWIPFKLYLVFLHGLWLKAGEVPASPAATKQEPEVTLEPKARTT